MAAKDRCAFLWIGITQPDIRQLENENIAPHRSVKEANPFTYWQRVQMISAALVSEGKLSFGEFGFCPFPIGQPEAIEDYVSRDAAFFTTVYEEWNEEKIKRLSEQGLRVEVLWKRSEKRYAGSEVRQLLRLNESFDHLVPQSVAKYLREHPPHIARGG